MVKVLNGNLFIPFFDKVDIRGQQITFFLECIPFRTLRKFFFLQRNFAGQPVTVGVQQFEQVTAPLFHPFHPYPFGIKRIQQCAGRFKRTDGVQTAVLTELYKGKLFWTAGFFTEHTVVVLPCFQPGFQRIQPTV